jgi:hypothetical protein
MGKIIDRVREREREKMDRLLWEQKRQALVAYYMSQPSWIFCNWIERWWPTAFGRKGKQ